MLYYNTHMIDAGHAHAPAMRENARARIDSTVSCAKTRALGMSAWRRLGVVAIALIPLWAGVFWALN